jgi:hypothetical protein
MCWYCWRVGVGAGTGAVPAEALADAHVARPLAAPLAVGEGVEVGFPSGLARADVAAAHEGCGGGGISECGWRSGVLGPGSIPRLLMVPVLEVAVPLKRGIGARSLHRFSICFDLYVDSCSLTLARW